MIPRWLWFDHVPAGVDLTTHERLELKSRSRELRNAHPSTMHKHGSLIASIIAWSILESALLLIVILWVFPMSQTFGPVGRYAVIIGLPLIICLPFWLMIAMAFNRSHAPFVRQALNDMGHAVCVNCGYGLRGLTGESSRCPECGAVREIRLKGVIESDSSPSVPTKHQHPDCERD
jgi:predicted RNA-binding Zn-ribbon protein involved in translation (DUF1610 family)